MPRVSKENMEKRENFIRDLFKQTPEMTVQAANEELKGKFGSRMSPIRAAEIRKEVTGKSGGGGKRGRKPVAEKAPTGIVSALRTNAAATLRTTEAITFIVDAEGKLSLEQIIESRALRGHIVKAKIVEE